MFNVFRENNLFTKCQSGFIPGGSCVAQLLSKLTKVLVVAQLEILRGAFLIFQKLLIRFGIKVYFLNCSLMESFEIIKKLLSIVLNEQTSTWLNITAGVPQGSVLEPVLFLIHINDLPDEITSSCKIFADDTSLFSKIENKSHSNFQLNKDLETIRKWAFQWKMLFNSDPVKQALEVCFSYKRDKVVYPPLQLNNNDVQSANSQKYLRLVLDSKLHFNKHVNNKINKCNESIGIIKK